MTIDDSLLIAYVEGLLPPDEHNKIESEIGHSPEAAARVEYLHASRLRYDYTFAHQKLPAVPASLIAKVEEITRAHQARAKAAAQIQIAAPGLSNVHAWPDTGPSAQGGANDAFAPAEAGAPATAPIRSRLRFAPVWLAAAFVAGAFFCGAVLRMAPGIVPFGPDGTSMIASTTGGPTPWVMAAVSYQQLYTRDTEAFTRPDIQASSQTVNAVRHDDGIALRIPDLSAAGLTFKRVQRLEFHNRALVQIVYLPEKGPPIALCVIKEHKPDQAVSPRNVDGMQVVSWRQGELGYALIGKPQGVDLVALGNRIAERSVDQLFGASSSSLPAALAG
jgi:anti-sigma factor RsiW